ncbi:MAG: hypothetical protein R3E33_06840 [Rhodocyclaceae bacterium]|uniref:hypothetical protein n=1 Tax=Thauera sp. ZXT1-4 TaxID=3460294 RepID=UPI00353D6502
MSAMKIKKLGFYLALGSVALIAAACSPQTAESECTSIKDRAAELNSRVPLKIDFVTTLVGVSVSYSDGICDVQITNSVNELTFIKTISLVNLEQNAAQLDLIQIHNLISHLNSEEGRGFYLEKLVSDLTEKPLIKSTHKDIKTTYVYIFDLGNIKPMKVTLLNRGQ